MNKDTHQISEAYLKTTGVDWEELALKRSRIHMLEGALKACLKHFEAEPTDPGHPKLIKVARQALEESFSSTQHKESFSSTQHSGLLDLL